MKWLHISDLHYNPPGQTYDTGKMREKLYEYIDKNNMSVNEVFFTGDFRFAKDANSVTAVQAASELRDIASRAGVTKNSHIHIVPGNHDFTRIEGVGNDKRTPTLDNARARYSDSGVFTGMVDGVGISYIDYLWNRFDFFRDVANELGSIMWQDSGLHHIREFSGYRVIYLNTAIACGRDDDRGYLVIGYENLYQILKDCNKSIPGIVLGHHELASFPASERNKIIDILNNNNVVLYLCGDAHGGDAVSFGSFVQITAGCLSIADKTEPVFYIGEISDAGIWIKAYKYDKWHPGWSPSDPITDEIMEKLIQAVPIPTPNILISEFETKTNKMKPISKDTGLHDIIADEILRRVSAGIPPNSTNDFSDALARTLMLTGLEGLFTYCGKGFVRAFDQLSEYSGNSKTPHYESVASFWYEGVDNSNSNDKIYPGSVISINGVVSLFIPLCPRHPRAIPGKKAETWINLRKAEKEGTSTLDFGTRDFVLWNDGVLIPPKNIMRKAIIGLSDKFGYVGHGCLPLIIDLSNHNALEIYDKLVDEQPTGYEAFVKGRVTPFSIHIAQDFGLAYDGLADNNEYPNYVLEVFELKLTKRHGILTGTMWVGYNDNSIFPIYCHLLNKSEYRKALAALSAEFKTDSGKVIAVHDTDPYELINLGNPRLNQYLIDILNKI